MSTPRAVFASPAATRALVHGRLGAVQMVLGAGTYLTLGQDWLLVVEPSGAAMCGPLSLGVEGMAHLQLEPGMPVEVSDRQLIVADAPISLERMRERPLPPVACRPIAHPRAITRATDAAAAELPPVSALLRSGIEALATGAVAEAAGLLAGVGDGLTPAGDDVLAGYAGWQAACRGPDRRQECDSLDNGASLSVLAAGRCSPLGLAYLRCAERAELPAAAARMVDAIRRGSPKAVRVAVPELRKWGGSSGLALGWGVAAAAAGASAPLPA